MQQVGTAEGIVNRAATADRRSHLRIRPRFHQVDPPADLVPPDPAHFPLVLLILHRLLEAGENGAPAHRFAREEAPDVVRSRLAGDHRKVGGRRVEVLRLHGGWLGRAAGGEQNDQWQEQMADRFHEEERAWRSGK